MPDAILDMNKKPTLILGGSDLLEPLVTAATQAAEEATLAALNVSGAGIPSAKSITDLNSITSSGFYRCEGAANQPLTSGVFGVIHLEGSGGRGYQIAMQTNTSIPSSMWFRSQDLSGNWAAWTQVRTAYNTAEFNSASTGASDFNSINKTGLYHATGAVGAPEETLHYVVQHWQGSTTARAVQIAIPGATTSGSPPIYIRNRLSAVDWGEWIEVMTSANGVTKNDLLFASRPMSTPEVDSLSAVVLHRPSHSQPVQMRFGKDTSTQRAPASLTKLATCLAALKILDSKGKNWLTEQVIIEAGDITSGSGANLQVGDVLSVQSIIANMLLPSSNTAAAALARHCQNLLGTSFIAYMNSMVSSLGASNTVFINPHGNPATGQLTTAYDMGLITLEAAYESRITSLWGLRSYNITVTGSNPRSISVTSTVSILDGVNVVGGKTGTITPGVYNLSLQLSSSGAERTVYVGLAGASDEVRYRDASSVIASCRNRKAYDLGSVGSVGTITQDFNSISVSGWYHNTVAGAAGAPHSTAYVVVNHIQGAEGRGYQYAHWTVTEGGVNEPRMAYRTRVGGVWTPWERIADYADVKPTGEFGPASTVSTDFNAISQNGRYYGVGATGAPHLTAYVALEHATLPDGRAVQNAQWGVTVGANVEPRSAIRYKTSSGWSNWSQTALASNETIIGDFGPSARAVTNIDDISVSGHYWSTSAPSLPSGGAFTSIQHIQISSGNRGHQIAWWGETVAGVTYLRSAMRFRGTSGTWGPWSTNEVSISGEDQIWKATTAGDTHISAGQVMIAPERSVFYNMASNTIYSTAAELKARYDQLVTDFPDYVTSEELGRDEWDNPIMQYTFSPPEILGEYGAMFPHPKICVSAGMHCGERPALVSMLCFADDLCRNWRGDAMLTQLRWGCKIVMVPNWCPSGINPSAHSPTGHSRLNGNGVDINRNFDYEWAAQTDPNKGPSAASELETQLIQSWPDLHPDAVVFFDQHSADAPSSGGEYPLWFITRPLTAPIVSSIARKQHAWMKREILLEEGNVPRVNISRSGAAWMTSYYNEVLGVKAFTIEGGMPANPSVSHLGSLGFGPLRLAYVKQMTFTLHEIWQWCSGAAGHVPIA